MQNNALYSEIILLRIFKRKWNSAVGTVTRLQAGLSGVRIRAGARELFLHHDIQTGGRDSISVS